MSGQSAGTVVVVYNPTKIDESELRTLAERYAEPGRRVEWVATTAEDDGEAQVAGAVPHGVDLVLVAGGDGTVRRIAAALAGTGIALGVLPVGTGNLLARNLGMDLELEASVRRAFQGADKEIDLCRATLHRPDKSVEHVSFVVMAGVGVDADMIHYTDADLKRRIGPAAYIGGVARSLGGGNSVQATVVLDGERFEGSLHTLIFGNCGDLINEIPLFPDALPDDGLFDVVAMTPSGIAGWARIGVKLADNTLRRRTTLHFTAPATPTDLTYAQATMATVEFTEPQYFEIDGDSAGEVVRLEIEIDPDVLTVRV